MSRAERTERLAQTKDKLAEEYERLIKTDNSKPRRQRFKRQGNPLIVMDRTTTDRLFGRILNVDEVGGSFVLR